MKNVKIGPLDSAVIFLESGTIEMVLPNQAKDEEVVQSTFNAMRCAILFNNEDLLALVDERLNDTTSKLRGSDN